MNRLMINGSKKLITLLLITSFVVSPYFAFVKNAEAQTNPTGYQGTPTSGYGAQSLGGAGSGLVGYISGIAPAIAQLPLCREKLGGAIKNLFSPNVAASAAISIGSSPYASMAIAAASLQKDLENIKNIGTIASTSVATYDEVANKKLDDLQKTTGTIQKSTSSLDENDTCLKSIARLVIKMLLQKITLSTVAWIQNGFEGKPFFIENTGEFLTDIARTEILQFGLEIDDPNIFPFGRDYMIRQASYFNRRFQENARYSLNELIAETSPGYNANDFIGDFSKGGWNGWISMTQVPANNPLGFQLIASEELSTRVNGQVTDINTRLSQADGFLGDQRCAEPKGLTREAHNAALEHPVRIPILDPTTGKVIGYEIQGICKRWEYVTPGKIVAEAATTAVNYPTDNLLKAEDMNDAVAAILDALLAKFSSTLMSKGFANLPSQGADGYLIINQDEFGYNYEPTQVENDFNKPLIRGWLVSNPHFNIRKDLTQALIDEQRIYVQKITEQNKIINDLVKTTYQLDYCIPGPHPGWELDSRRVLTAAENSIVSKTPADMEKIDDAHITGIVKAAGYATGAAIGAAIGAGTGPFAPVAAPIGAAIGALVGFIVDIIGKPPEKKLEAYYNGIIKQFTGIHIDHTKDDQAHFRNKQEVTGGFDKVFEQYLDVMHKHFTPGFLPAVASEAAIKFSYIPGYRDVYTQNEEKIVALDGVIKRLSTLKDAIATLNATLGQNPSQAQIDAYETKLKDYISEFSRLAGDMVSGDDIAYVDTSLAQSKDEIVYIYKDLIKGQFGCEQDLKNNFRLLEYPADPAKTHLLRGTKRIEYPFAVWYDYNEYKPGVTLPTIPALAEYLEPGDLVPTTSMPNDPQTNGPGFLSAVYFDYSINDGFSCNTGYPKSWQLDCISAQKAFQSVDSWPVSVGRNGYKRPGYSNNPALGGESSEGTKGTKSGKKAERCNADFDNDNMLVIGVNGINADTVVNNCQVDVSFEQMLGIY